MNVNIFKFPYAVDVSEIKQEILDNPNCWDFDRSRETLYEQKDTRTIPLRAGKKRMGIALYDSHEIFDTPLVPYFPKTMAFIDYFMSEYNGACGRIAIVKLESGKDVVPHIDFGDYYRKRDRFHLVIDGMYQYTVDGESDVFGAGDLFWFNSQKIHHTKALGEVPRLVIIFDVLNSKFREILNVR